MSLYNNVSASSGFTGPGGTFMGSLKGAINDTLGGAIDGAAGALGGGKLVNAIAGKAKTAARGVTSSLINKAIPPQAQRFINIGADAGASLLSGDWESAALKVWDSGIIRDLLPAAAGSLLSQTMFWGSEVPGFGGLTAQEAKEWFSEAIEVDHAKKNLWLLEVSSELGGGSFNIDSRFNLLATEVEYSPFIIQADKEQVGSATVDLVRNNEPVEMSITTLDDKDGTIKKWFAMHTAAACPRDGTVTEPGNYAIRIRVLHGYIKDHPAGYEDIGLFRPENLSVSLSRRDDNLEEIQMTFSQLDTFMSP